MLIYFFGKIAVTQLVVIVRLYKFTVSRIVNRKEKPEKKL